MPSTQNSPLPPSRILLIEDDISLGDSLREGLKPDQVDLATAESTDVALERLGQEHFDLLLLDLGLPGSDGFELLESLKSDEHLRETPIIILTANASAADKVRAFDLGAVDYITKPFELAELRARVRSALKVRRLQRELIAANHTLDSARIAAVEAAEGKAEFLATMSHEIRTPMNGVIAMTSLLMQTDLASDQRDFVETIRSSGESLLTIIDDILHFSKLESGKMELEQRPMDLRHCAEETLDLLAARAAEKNLDLVLDIEPSTPTQVVGDGTRIRQIILNLVNNAIKFTVAGSVSIHVTSRAPEAGHGPSVVREFLVSVRDTGIGIPADKLGRLFRSFSQVDSSINRQYGGTGLGLAISKGLVELMGGRVWVESAEGAGSTFHFTLHLSEVASSGAPSVAAPAVLVGQRVLIVEDGTVHRSTLEQQFLRWGARPVAVATAEEALAEVAKVPGFTLAVIDCQLPGRPGASLAAELRKVRNHHSLPVILLNVMGGQVEGGDSLANHWTTVGKPVKPSQLLPAVSLLLSGTVAVPARKHQAVSKMDAQLASRLPLRILLTDDNVINQKVAVRLLQQLGYKADTAGNGVEAIRAVEQNGYDVILMDVQMPEMDGLEATRQIRARQKENPAGNFSRPIAIIAMTANAMQGDREKCLAAGMDDYLPKPVRPEALQAMLEKHGERVSKESVLAMAADTANASPPSAAAPPELKVISGTPVRSIVEQPPVDMERLNDFAGGSQENYNELVGLYIKQTTEQLEQIRVTVASRDAEGTSRVAHSCAGASATCGMLAIVPLLRQIEHLSQDEKIDEAAAIVPQVEREFERLKRFLENQKPIALAG
jgi:CheY-like chemotaxis protein/HPt (histidine-containing phosphotransfer) domain-containing protein